MPTLYDLTSKYAQLLDYEETLDPTVFHDTLDSIQDTIEDKAVGYAKVISQFQSDSEQLKTEISRLTFRKNMIDRKVDIMKSALTEAMQDTDTPKIKTPQFTIWVQKNPVKMVVEDETRIPASFMEQKLVLDTKKLKDALKAGEEISGAKLAQTEGVRIK